MKKNLQSLVWAVLILGVGILVFRGMKNNPEWRSFSGKGFLESLVHVRLGYLLAGLAITLLCYLIRALRWREFLFPVQRISVRSLFAAVTIGFCAVSLLGRAGEIARPFILSREGELPLSISLTAIVVERLFDFSAILALFLANLAFFHFNSAITPENLMIFRLFTRGAAVMLGLLLGISGVLFLFQMNAVRWIDFLIEKVWIIPKRFEKRLEQLLKSFVAGLAFIAHPRPLAASILYSFSLWLMTGVGNFFIVRAFGIPFTFSMTIVLLTFSAMGAVIQLPGVGGGYQALTLYALVGFLGVNPTVGSGITLVAWTIAFFPVVGIGIYELVRSGWSLRSLRMAAEKEVATALAGPDAAMEDAGSRF